MASKKTKPVIRIWCDGSVEKQHGRGGWGAVLVASVKGREVAKPFSGVVDNVTSQRMELIAAVCAMAQVQGARRMRIHSDSAYLINGMTSGKVFTLYDANRLHTIPNADIWAELVESHRFHDVEWVKVEAHAGDPNNEWAHQLAYDACKELGRFSAGDVVDVYSEDSAVNTIRARLHVRGRGRPMPLPDSDLVDYGDYTSNTVDGPAVDHPAPYPDWNDHFVASRAPQPKFPKMHRHIVEDMKDPKRIEAKNPRTGSWEEARLINLLGGTARVLFESTPISEGYGQGGRSRRYAPTDDLSESDIRVPEEVT